MEENATPDRAAVAASDVGRAPHEVRIGDAAIPVWPSDQPLRIVQGRRIVVTRFADAVSYHPALLAAIQQAADDPRFRDPTTRTLQWGCGFKVRDLPAWGAPAVALVHARALALAHRAMGLGPIYCDDSWGNIYRNGEYCPPHTHVRADVSVVYMVDQGDLEPADGFSGRLMFMDPRLEWCCAREPGRPTRPFIPDMIEGAMVAFASELLHSVNPYAGQRPRVTLSWNFTSTRLPDEGRPRLAVPQ